MLRHKVLLDELHNLPLIVHIDRTDTILMRHSIHSIAATLTIFGQKDVVINWMGGFASICFQIILPNSCAVSRVQGSVDFTEQVEGRSWIAPLSRWQI
jgi:hypothetical protein